MSSVLIAPSKPKNARSKRAAKAREPVPVEKGNKTAIFVKSASMSDRVKIALSELHQLKKPNSINFSKPNAIRPFEDPASLEFWAVKNDASLFLIGTHTKKRPHGLVWVRCFNGQVMEMLEVGIEEVMPLNLFKGPKSTVGAAPIFHFAATTPNESLWDSHPTYMQFKSLVLDFFRGEELDGVALKGLERIISVTIGGTEDSSEDAQTKLTEAITKAQVPVESLFGNTKGPNAQNYEEEKGLPVIHFRTYMVSFMRSGVPTPIVKLEPHGPHFTFSLRRTQAASEEMWKAANKKKAKAASSKTKANKNVDVNSMGDKVGRIYIEQQNLDTLQSRKFKALKKRPAETEPESQSEAKKSK